MVVYTPKCSCGRSNKTLLDDHNVEPGLTIRLVNEPLPHLMRPMLELLPVVLVPNDDARHVDLVFYFYERGEADLLKKMNEQRADTKILAPSIREPKYKYEGLNLTLHTILTGGQCLVPLA